MTPRRSAFAAKIFTTSPGPPHPHFQIADDTFVNSLGPVKLHALILASHADQSDRYLSVLKQSMQKFDEWYGPYPYKQITLIDPEPDSESEEWSIRP